MVRLMGPIESDQKSCLVKPGKELAGIFHDGGILPIIAHHSNQSQSV